MLQLLFDYIAPFCWALLGIVIATIYFNLKNQKMSKSDNDDELQDMAVAVWTGDLATVKDLVAKGYDIQQLQDGVHPLHVASGQGHLEVVKFFTSLDPELKNVKAAEKELLPIHVAAHSGQTEIVSFFIEVLKMDVESTLDNGSTLLHIACLEGHLGLVRWLVQHGANAYAKEKNGFIPCHLAIAEGHLEIVKYFATELEPEIFNKKDESGNSSIHLAAASGRNNIVKFLLEEENVDVNTTSDGTGGTALHLAAKQGLLGTTKLLAEKGANSEIKDFTGHTAQEYAKDYNNMLVFEFLTSR